MLTEIEQEISFILKPNLKSVLSEDEYFRKNISMVTKQKVADRDL